MYSLRHLTWSGRRGEGRRAGLTVTFHALVDEAVEQRAAVVAERGAAVRVDLKLVLASGVLEQGYETEKKRKRFQHLCQKTLKDMNK